MPSDNNIYCKVSPHISIALVMVWALTETLLNM